MKTLKSKKMKNNNKLFEKQIELKSSKISGGRASDTTTYKNTQNTYVNEHGCTVIYQTVQTDQKQMIEECWFTNCPS